MQTTTLDSAPLTTAQLRALIDDDTTLRILDVRSGAEFDAVHIPGSYNVPLDTLREHAHDLAAVDHPVVLVCKSGGRAGQAHTDLRSAGKHRLHILDGGIDAWQSTGGDVVHADTRVWAMDRQVRLVAGSLVLAGILTSVRFGKFKWIAAAVGAGLTFSAATNSCAMANVLGRLPYNRGRGCDIAGVLDQLQASA